MSHIYREKIIDHYKNPRNFGDLPDATVKAHDENPLCGDSLDFALKINEENDMIEKVKFKGKGCALSIASASMLTKKIKGKNVEDIMKLEKDDILKMMGVHPDPARIKCVLLSLKVAKLAAIKYLQEKEKRE